MRLVRFRDRWCSVTIYDVRPWAFDASTAAADELSGMTRLRATGGVVGFGSTTLELTAFADGAAVVSALAPSSGGPLGTLDALDFFAPDVQRVLVATFAGMTGTPFYADPDFALWEANRQLRAIAPPADPWQGFTNRGSLPDTCGPPSGPPAERNTPPFPEPNVAIATTTKRRPRRPHQH